MENLILRWKGCASRELAVGATPFTVLMAYINPSEDDAKVKKVTITKMRVKTQDMHEALQDKSVQNLLNGTADHVDSFTDDEDNLFLKALREYVLRNEDHDDDSEDEDDIGSQIDITWNVVETGKTIFFYNARAGSPGWTTLLRHGFLLR